MATYTPIELPMTVSSDTPTLSMSVAGNLVIGGHVPVLQTKTVYPSSTDQTIEPDTGYDALDEVDVMAVVVTNLSAANIVDGVTVKVGDANDDDSIASVTGTAQTGITPTGTLSLTQNGTENCSAYEYVDVDVANSYAVGDEGKVVHGGALVSQSSATYTQNNTYDTTLIDEVTVQVEGGGSATLGTKSVTANGTYKAEDDSLDGYSQVTVSVPASAVDTGTKSITTNGNNQDVVGYAAVNVNVPNTYSAGDEGKVVSSGALVSQTAHADVTPTTSDQTIDTTTNNSIKVKGDADLVAGNIKKDVEIFGVTGSYEGGGGGGLSINDVLQGTAPSGSVSFTPTANIPAYGISGRTALTGITIDFSNGNYNLERDSIRNNSSLTKVHLIYASNGTKDMPEYMMTSNSALNTVVIQGSVQRIRANMLRGNPSLANIDIGKTSSSIEGIQNNAFYQTALVMLVLRKTDSVILLDNTSAFNGTKFQSGGTGGTLYVPNDLISSYQSASNWSTILGYATNSIKSIESTHTDPTAPIDLTLYYADGSAI